MMTQPSGMLWDLDNTLYRVDAAIEHEFQIAVAHAVIEWGVTDLTFEEAVTLGLKSFEKHHYSGYIFMQRYSISQHDMHYLTDKFLNHSLIKKCAETCDLFAKSTANHALITHSARRWALKTLRDLDLHPWFPEERVFAFENYDFQSKSKSRKPFEMALAAINKNPDDSMMVEDIPDNLRVPHEMGMTTIHLHHGRPMTTLPDYVDYSFANARELMAVLYSKASL